jgi:hypothetical protein
MCSRRRSGLILSLATVPLIMLAFFGAGCTGTDNSQTSSETTDNQTPDGTPPQMPGRGIQNLDEVAAILGIKPQELEDAFNQAMSEMFGEGQMPSGENIPEGTPPEGTMPEGEPPEGKLPEGTPPEGQPGMMSEELLARVAEILDIDLETLQDAFTQVQEAVS